MRCSIVDCEHRERRSPSSRTKRSTSSDFGPRLTRSPTNHKRFARTLESMRSQQLPQLVIAPLDIANRIGRHTTLEARVETSILYRFRDVLGGDGGAGSRSAMVEDTQHRDKRAPRAAGGRAHAQELIAVPVGRAMTVYLTRAEEGIGFVLARKLRLVCLRHAAAIALDASPGTAPQALLRAARALPSLMSMRSQAAPTRDRDNGRCVFSGVQRQREVRSPQCRKGKGSLRRRAENALGTAPGARARADRDEAGFERLAQRFQNIAVEFRQLIEEQDAVVRQRDLTGGAGCRRPTSAAAEALVMRRRNGRCPQFTTSKPLLDTEWIAATSSASASDNGGRMPGNRAASIDLPVPGGRPSARCVPGSRDLQRALDLLLALNVGEVA